MEKNVSFSLKTKFGRDVLWNFASFVILGASGIVLNIFIARFFGADALGIFNIVFAIYIFASQLAVFGIHFSVLKQISIHAENRIVCNSIITAALILTTFFSLFTIILSLLTIDIIGQVLHSDSVRIAWLYVIPALWFFAINKVLINVLNGFRKMRAFAISQSLRYVLMIFFLCGATLAKLSGKYLAVIITGTEVSLFLGLAIYNLRLFNPTVIEELWYWIKNHFHFGLRGVFSGTIAEINTRIDVLMLGLFVTDESVGIYSIAALIIEGIAQLPLVIRNNLNPLIASLVITGEYAKLKHNIFKVVQFTYYIMLATSLIAYLLFPLFIQIFIDNPIFNNSYLPFSILLLGLLISSGYLPLDMFLIQAGFPGYQTFIKVIILLSNIILNSIFIPSLGIVGAAIATSLSFVFSVFLLKTIVKKKIGITI